MAPRKKFTNVSAERREEGKRAANASSTSQQQKGSKPGRPVASAKGEGEAVVKAKNADQAKNLNKIISENGTVPSETATIALNAGQAQAMRDELVAAYMRSGVMEDAARTIVSKLDDTQVSKRVSQLNKNKARRLEPVQEGPIQANSARTGDAEVDRVIGVVSDALGKRFSQKAVESASESVASCIDYLSEKMNNVQDKTSPEFLWLNNVYDHVSEIQRSLLGLGQLSINDRRQKVEEIKQVVDNIAPAVATQTQIKREQEKAKKQRAKEASSNKVVDAANLSQFDALSPDSIDLNLGSSKQNGSRWKNTVPKRELTEEENNKIAQLNRKIIEDKEEAFKIEKLDSVYTKHLIVSRKRLERDHLIDKMHIYLAASQTELADKCFEQKKTLELEIQKAMLESHKQFDDETKRLEAELYSLDPTKKSNARKIERIKAKLHTMAKDEMEDWEWLEEKAASTFPDMSDNARIVKEECGKRRTKYSGWKAEARQEKETNAAEKQIAKIEKQIEKALTTQPVNYYEISSLIDRQRSIYYGLINDEGLNQERRNNYQNKDIAALQLGRKFKLIDEIINPNGRLKNSGLKLEDIDLLTTEEIEALNIDGEFAECYKIVTNKKELEQRRANRNKTTPDVERAAKFNELINELWANGGKPVQTENSQVAESAGRANDTKAAKRAEKLQKKIEKEREKIAKGKVKNNDELVKLLQEQEKEYEEVVNDESISPIERANFEMRRRRVNSQIPGTDRYRIVQAMDNSSYQSEKLNNARTKGIESLSDEDVRAMLNNAKVASVTETAGVTNAQPSETASQPTLENIETSRQLLEDIMINQIGINPKMAKQAVSNLSDEAVAKQLSSYKVKKADLNQTQVVLDRRSGVDSVVVDTIPLGEETVSNRESSIKAASSGLQEILDSNENALWNKEIVQNDGMGAANYEPSANANELTPMQTLRNGFHIHLTSLGLQNDEIVRIINNLSDEQIVELIRPTKTYEVPVKALLDGFDTILESNGQHPIDRTNVDTENNNIFKVNVIDTGKGIDYTYKYIYTDRKTGEVISRSIYSEISDRLNNNDINLNQGPIINGDYWTPENAAPVAQVNEQEAQPNRVGIDIDKLQNAIAIKATSPNLSDEQRVNAVTINKNKLKTAFESAAKVYDKELNRDGSYVSSLESLKHLDETDLDESFYKSFASNMATGVDYIIKRLAKGDDLSKPNCVTISCLKLMVESGSQKFLSVFVNELKQRGLDADTVLEGLGVAQPVQTKAEEEVANKVLQQTGAAAQHASAQATHGAAQTANSTQPPIINGETGLPITQNPYAQTATDMKPGPIINGEKLSEELAKAQAATGSQEKQQIDADTSVYEEVDFDKRFGNILNNAIPIASKEDGVPILTLTAEELREHNVQVHPCSEVVLANVMANMGANVGNFYDALIGISSKDSSTMGINMTIVAQMREYLKDEKCVREFIRTVLNRDFVTGPETKNEAENRAKAALSGIVGSLIVAQSGKTEDEIVKEYLEDEEFVKRSMQEGEELDECKDRLRVRLRTHLGNYRNLTTNAAAAPAKSGSSGKKRN